MLKVTNGQINVNGEQTDHISFGNVVLTTCSTLTNNERKRYAGS